MTKPSYPTWNLMNWLLHFQAQKILSAIIKPFWLSVRQTTTKRPHLLVIKTQEKIRKHFANGRAAFFTL